MFVTWLMLAALLVPVPPPPAGGANDESTRPPPVVLAGGRSVVTTNSTGGLQRHTLIPSTSVFGTYSSTSVRTCTFTADHDETRLSNNTVVPKGTVVTSSYLFVEAPLPNPTIVGSAGLDLSFGIPDSPLADGMRSFGIWCDSNRYLVAFKGLIDVSISDAFLDPIPRLAHLLNTLQLDRPTVFTNPVVDTYGGLVTRYPAWLAITADAWRIQQSPAEDYRGTTLLLIAQPRNLEFIVEFTPNPDKPSPAYRGVVGCVPAIAATEQNDVIPPFPVLPDQTKPGVNGPCMWTPPGPGTVTVTASITYTITFWADGWTENQDDYTWTSDPTTYVTGELIAVNTKP
jgi:hypothetical protein